MKIEVSPKEYEKWLNWHDAMMYCQLLIIDGKDDWRLPTKEELDYIYNSENDFVGSYYWSSTLTNGGNSWLKCMASGRQTTSFDRNIKYYVQPVRTS